MRRRLLILLLLPLLKVSAQMGSGDDPWGRNLVAFNNVFCKYFKKYWGCLPEEMNPQNCRPSQGVRDYKLEEEMIKAWEKLMK
jgi:hypothetical protein